MKTINSPGDLVTTQEEIVEGFAWQAERKAKLAEEYRKKSQYVLSKIDEIEDIDEIREDEDLFDFFTAACMLSQKSLNHLPEYLQNEILEELIDVDKLDNPAYVRELESRYFLTSGDSLGGSMRNIIGKSAQVELSERIIRRLYGKGHSPEIIKNRSKTKIQEIHWPNRRIFFDKVPGFIGKSIDIIVVKGHSALIGDTENPKDYTCCGELKGGVDPAGADEHWKTAMSALTRIEEIFRDNEFNIPNLVFIGRAIEHSMAEEIYAMLENGWLAGAANINNRGQLDEVIDIILT